VFFSVGKGIVLEQRLANHRWPKDRQCMNRCNDSMASF
jgi:hypothetical protein